ncbi:MAG: type II toxin-antitoxin system VapC family toxin [Acidobacteriota bacterium]
MERCLTDTDVLIDHLRGYAEAQRFLSEAAAGKYVLHYSVVSKAEILAGMRNGEEEGVNLLFRGMNEVPVDGLVAEMAGEYMRRYRRSHRLLLPDALVAACAKRIDAALATLNNKHYPMTDVRVLVPYERPTGRK